MSLPLSPEMEERIAAYAERDGVSVNVWLQRLIEENEATEHALSSLEARGRALSASEIQGKIERGVAQLERGEVVDGEEFVSGLLASLDDPGRKRRAG